MLLSESCANSTYVKNAENKMQQKQWAVVNFKFPFMSVADKHQCDLWMY
jgi:hypothetical protein